MNKRLRKNDNGIGNEEFIVQDEIDAIYLLAVSFGLVIRLFVHKRV